MGHPYAQLHYVGLKQGQHAGATTYETSQRTPAGVAQEGRTRRCRPECSWGWTSGGLKPNFTLLWMHRGTDPTRLNAYDPPAFPHAATRPEHRWAPVLHSAASRVSMVWATLNGAEAVTLVLGASGGIIRCVAWGWHPVRVSGDWWVYGDATFLLVAPWCMSIVLCIMHWHRWWRRFPTIRRRRHGARALHDAEETGMALSNVEIELVWRLSLPVGG